MENIDAEVFDLNIGGRDYTFELDRDSLKEADSMGVGNANMGLFARTAIILYAGLKKHNPFLMPSQVSRKGGLLDQALEDGYDFGSFAPMVDEFTKWYNAFFTDQGGKKIISRRQAVKVAKK